MNKWVEFTYTASRWMIRHEFLTEDVVVGVLRDFPKSKRMPLKEKDCFQIFFRRKKDSRFVEVAVWVHEYPSRLLVYKLHSY